MNDSSNPYASPQSVSLDPPAATLGGRIPATFGERFLAALIDAIILWAVRWVIGRASHSSVGILSIRGVSGIFIAWFYNALQESSARQGTIGKVAMGIRVTDMKGERIDFARATGRHFSKYISIIILFIGYLWMLWDDQKQTLHDKISGCFVNSSKRTA